MEVNKIENRTIEKINEKIWYFEKINRIDKPLN